MANNERATRLCNDKRMGSSIPKSMCCPLSGKLMKDPVKTDSGITYDSSSIEKWLSNGNIHCFITGKEISHNLIPDRKLAVRISEWKNLYSQMGDAAQNELEWLLQKIKTQGCQCDKFLNNLTRLRSLIKKERWPSEELQKFRPGDILADKLASMNMTHCEDTMETAEKIICTFKYLVIDITTTQKILNPSALATVAFVMKNSRLKTRIEAMRLINRVACEELFVDQIVCVEGLIRELLELLLCSQVDCNDKSCTMITMRRLCRRREVKVRLKSEGAVRVVRSILSSNKCDQLVFSIASELSWDLHEE